MSVPKRSPSLHPPRAMSAGTKCPADPSNSADMDRGSAGPRRPCGPAAGGTKFDGKTDGNFECLSAGRDSERPHVTPLLTIIQQRWKPLLLFIGFFTSCLSFTFASHIFPLSPKALRFAPQTQPREPIKHSLKPPRAAELKHVPPETS